MEESMVIEEAKRSEQLNQKVTPAVRKKLDDILKKMGHTAERDGHVKWDQDRLLEVLGIVESTLVLDDHENYAEFVKTINQYTSLINAKLISLIQDLDTTEARIRSEYEKKLASKDSIIKDLQAQRAEQESVKNSAVEDASRSKDAQTAAEKRMEDVLVNLQKSEETIKDKENIIQMLNGKLAEADKKATGYDALKASEDSLQKQVTLVMHQKEISDNDLKHEISEKQSLQKELEDLKVKMEEAKAEISKLHDSEQSLQRDLVEQKRTAAQELKAQQDTAAKELELAVEKATAKAKDEMREQLDNLRDEKTRLQVQMSMMQKENQGVK